MRTWFLPLSFLAFSLPLVCGSDFKLLYGGVVAQEVTGVSNSDDDVTIAVQVAQKTVQRRASSVEGALPTLHKVTKLKLYYSADGQTPFVYDQHYIVSNRHFLRRMHISLGLLFTISLSSSEWPQCPSVWYNVTITRDQQLEYHVYQHTFSQQWAMSKAPINSTDPSVCKQIGAKPHPSEKHSYHSSFCHSYWFNSMEQCTPDSKYSASQSSLNFNHPFYCRTPADRVQSCCPHTKWSYLRHLSSNASMSGNPAKCERLKVGTYNVWNLNRLEQEEYADRLTRLGKMISLQSLDIVGFQEVRLEAGHGTNNQIGQLAEFFPDYQYVFQPSMLYMHQINLRTEEGVAIFSKYPILGSDYILLDRSVVELWQYMSRFRGVKLLMGDLNAEPESRPIRFLRGEQVLGGVLPLGMVDSWLAGGSGEEWEGLTFPALQDQPIKRIDYIFLHQDSKEAFVNNTRVLKGEDQCYSPCSDHYGLVTSLGFHCA